MSQVHRLRLRMEELEASITEQQDRCMLLARELQIKSERVEVLENEIHSLKTLRCQDGSAFHRGPSDEGKGQRQFGPPVQVPDLGKGALSLEQLQTELKMAYERIRRQETELEALRGAYEQGRELNAYLMAELQRTKQLWLQQQQASEVPQQPTGAMGVVQVPLPTYTQAYNQPYLPVMARSVPSSYPELPIAAAPSSFPPSPRLLPTPKCSGAGQSPCMSSTWRDPSEQDLPDLPEDIPTVGSLWHAEGTCRPCFYVFSKSGCHFGRSCKYCHMDHAKRKKERPPKMVREECKQIAQEVFRNESAQAAASEDVEDLRHRTQLSSSSRMSKKYTDAVLRAMNRQSQVGDASSSSRLHL
ncbi:unnamed protein product [Symbiodinium sp. CCMP2592]|nr:unnamed protein product [Symbiodinium sp. CCMP2592]